MSRTNALIEYSHRFTALVVGLFVVALFAVVWRRYRDQRRLMWSASAAVVLWLFQAILGGLVVGFGLTPALVTAHLATATLFVGTLVFATVASFAVAVEIQGSVDRLTRLAWGVAGAVFALIVVGGLVRGEGAGLAFPDWPLMDGRVIPSLGGLRPALQFVHRGLAVVVGAGVVLLAVRTWPFRKTRTPAAVLAAVAVALFAAQILIGAANVWTRLAVGPVVAHVAVSSLIWGCLVGAATATRACGCKERMTWAALAEGAVAEPLAVAP